MKREKAIYRVTLLGALVNSGLVVMKFVAGLLGGSAAMIADAVHSLSDFLTDIVLVLLVKLSAKPVDEDHKYGHGKYETMATTLIGLSLLLVGVSLLVGSVEKIVAVIGGATLPPPGILAFVAALVSVVSKEWVYRITVRVGKRHNSPAVVANAWHHRSDAFSSVGTAIGIGGAIFLGSRWTVLDPLAAAVVSILIMVTAITLVKDSCADLLERSLPREVEQAILSIAAGEPGVSQVHNLRTRRIGTRYAIEMHVRMPGDISLYEAHQRASSIERKLRERFGTDTHIAVHTEPLK